MLIRSPGDYGIGPVSFDLLTAQPHQGIGSIVVGCKRTGLSMRPVRLYFKFAGVGPGRLFLIVRMRSEYLDHKTPGLGAECAKDIAVLAANHIEALARAEEDADIRSQ